MVGGDTLCSWQSPHLGALTQAVGAVTVGKATWEPLSPPLLRKTTSRMGTASRWDGLKDAGVVTPTTSSFGLLTGPCRRRTGLGERQWIVINAAGQWLQWQPLYQTWFHRLSKSTPPLVPDVQLASGKCFFPLIPVSKDHQKAVCFGLAKPATHLHCPTPGT